MIRATFIIFKSFEIKADTYSFNYIIDDSAYQITLKHSSLSTLNQAQQLTVIFNLGMCYLLDIAEMTVPEKIFINFKLENSQLSFWKSLYQQVSKENMCVLQMDLKLLDNIWEINPSGQYFNSFSLSSDRKDVTICLTGGKESLTLLKLLQDMYPLQLFFLDTELSVHRQKVYDRVKDEFKTIRTISNRREIFREIKQKHQSKLSSGLDMAHLVFNSLLFGSKYVLIGNEYSSNFPNLVYQGYSINHQFVKTIDFAKQLNDYLHEYVTTDFTYYSPFFSLYEYFIARELFRSTEYLEVWTSCNKTTPTTNFCCNCPKCAFTYLISLLYTTPTFLKNYFSRDLLEDLELFKPLMDFTGEKPLECVGEKVEVWTALNELLNNSDLNNKPVLKYFEERIKPFIISELPKFKKDVTSIQKVPVMLPDDLQKLITDVFSK